MCFTLFRDNFYKNFASSESIDRKEKKDNLFQEYSNVLRLNSYRQRLNGSLLYKQVVQLNRVTLIWIPKSWQRVNIHQSTDIARFNYHESSEKSEREKNRRETIQSTQAWKMFLFKSATIFRKSPSTRTVYRYSAYFERKADVVERREREEGGFTSHSAKIIWQSVPKAGVARAGAPSDSTTGMRGSFRTRCCRWRISGRGVGSRPYSTVCNARPLSKYRSQFSPAKWIVETGPVPPHQFSVTIVTLFRCLVETC